MMPQTIWKCLLIFSGFLACSTALADLKVAGIFQDHMVLQREKTLPIWGLADSRSSVTITANGQTKTITADADGRWNAMLDPMKASNEPVPLKVSSNGKEVSFADVLVGEVWFAAGQSNMCWTVKQSLNSEQELANAKFPRIREFLVIQRLGFAQPRETTERIGGWYVCSPEKVGEFSAVGYFFAREIHQKLDVPVGIIHSAAGGIPAEPMTPMDAIEGHPALNYLLAERGIGYGPGIKSKEENEKSRKDWTEKMESLIIDSKKVAEGWADTKFNDSAWEPAKVSDRDMIHGAIWLRFPFPAPATIAGKAATLCVGNIEGQARIFVNGKELTSLGNKDGTFTRETQNVLIPSGVITETDNVLAIRIVSKEYGRCYMKEGYFYLMTEGQQEKHHLPVQGRKCLEEQLKPIAPYYPGLLGNLYNGMVAPIIPYQVRGVLWYQGESNTGKWLQYRELFPAMITGWRKHWGQPELPFLFVQLANWMPSPAQPVDDEWSKLREAQQMTLSLPSTGMAVAIDIGDEKSIHPLNKQEVGRRLSLVARAKVYGETTLGYSGPMYASNKIEGDRMRISFDHVNGGLTTRNNEPIQGFAIAGADGRFQWADAKIDGPSVVVWNDKIKNPTQVRYAWSRNPVCNLYNKTGLPAVPFRTDSDAKN